MENNYYDATGVLVLDRITPVICALFGRFRLNANCPGSDQDFIVLVTETHQPLWDDVLMDLAALAVQLDLPAPHCGNEDGDDSDEELGMAVMLNLFAGHFGTSGNADLLNLIEHHSFDGAADLDALFLIATCLNDGHGLEEIRLEGGWRCGKPRLSGFGGDGRFLSRELEVSSSSSHAVELGQLLRPALVHGHIGVAAWNLVTEIRKILAGVKNDDQREELQSRVAAMLGEYSASKVATAHGESSIKTACIESECWVIYSPNEAAASGDGAGFWSNQLGWVRFDQATIFSLKATWLCRQPASLGSDARFVSWREAKRH